MRPPDEWIRDVLELCETRAAEVAAVAARDAEHAALQASNLERIAELEAELKAAEGKHANLYLRAVNYEAHAEHDRGALCADNDALRERVAALEGALREITDRNAIGDSPSTIRDIARRALRRPEGT